MGAEATVAKVLTPMPAAYSTARHRVLMTTDTVSDVWPYAIELSKALIARGHAVALAAMGGMPSREQQHEVAAVPGLALHASAYKLAWMDEPWDDMRAASKWLLNLARDLRPTVVHLNDFGHADLPWPAPVLSVAHSCVLSWWRAVHGAPPPPAWMRYRHCVQASLRASDLLVAPTNAALRSLERYYGMHCEARVIAHGRSPSTEQSAAKGPWIFSSARMDDAGGNGQALANVAGRLSWPIYFGGGMSRHDSSAAAVIDNVRALGQLGNAQWRRWLAHTSIYAAPARYEPYGLCILDAALARCALVLGDIDSLRELWDGAALFVAPDDEDALARTLQQLIDDEMLRERYAALAARRAQTYTPAGMTEAYLRAYNDIAEPRGITASWAQPARATLVEISTTGAAQEERHGNLAFPHVWNRQPDRHHDHVIAWHGRNRSHRGSRRPDP